jgi:hypothetical protein
MFLYCVSDSAFWAQANKPLGFLAIFEKYHRWYAKNVEALSRGWVFVNVEFAN